jgi:ureidoacrylate peracid hydrolase
MDPISCIQERCDPRTSALLVVDVQNDFCSPDGDCGRRYDISAVQRVAPRIVRFIEEARKVRLPIIYLKTIENEWTDSLAWKNRKPLGKVPNTCREGSWGVEFFDGIAPLSHERVVIKHRYSGFIHTDLEMSLKVKGVQAVLLTGVTTNVCVESTARDAFMYDYHVVVIEDCVAAYDQKLHETSLENIRRHFGLVLDSSAIVEAWHGIKKPQAGTAA